MLRSLAHLMGMRIPQLPRYLEMYLTTSCNLSPSQDPSASTTAGYKQSQPPQATSCYKPPSHCLQDQGYRMVSLSPPLSLHLPALEETKPAMPTHLLHNMLELEKTKLTTPHHPPTLFPQKPASSELFLGQAPLRLEKTKLVTPLHLPLYANVGYKQLRPPQAMSCDQPPSHGQQDQGYRTCPRSPPPSSTPPTCEQAMSSLDPIRSPPRAPIQGHRDTGRVHSLPLPTLSFSQLQASCGRLRPFQAGPISHGPQDEPQPTGRTTAFWGISFSQIPTIPLLRLRAQPHRPGYEHQSQGTSYRIRVAGTTSHVPSSHPERGA